MKTRSADFFPAAARQARFQRADSSTADAHVSGNHAFPCHNASRADDGIEIVHADCCANFARLGPVARQNRPGRGWFSLVTGAALIFMFANAPSSQRGLLAMIAIPKTPPAPSAQLARPRASPI